MRILEDIRGDLVLRLYDKAKGLSSRACLSELRNSAKLDVEQLEALRLSKLQRLVKHAYENVDYYREVMDSAGVAPSDIRTLSDLQYIPALRRNNIQKNFKQLLAEGFALEDCYQGSSSGSTGEPVRYLRDRAGSSMGQAVRYFGWELASWRFRHRYLTLWGNPTTVQQDWSRLSSKIKSALFGEVKFPAYELSDTEAFSELANLCKKEQFDYIQGYTNAIYGLAVYAKEHDIELPTVQGVLTTAENLMPHQRALIETVLGPVYDFYGCGEINGIAFQCNQQSGYHIMDPHVIVEYGDAMDDEGNYELLITDLDNYAMPLLRYANGDMGVRGPQEACDCGLNFSRLQRVAGRVSDVIPTPDGGRMSVPSVLGSRLLKELRGLLRYQAELVSPNHININIETNDEFDEIQESVLRDALGEYLSASFEWDIVKVPQIKAGANGKYKLFVDSTKVGV